MLEEIMFIILSIFVVLLLGTAIYTGWQDAFRNNKE